MDAPLANNILAGFLGFEVQWEHRFSVNVGGRRQPTDEPQSMVFTAAAAVAARPLRSEDARGARVPVRMALGARAVPFFDRDERLATQATTVLCAATDPG